MKIFILFFISLLPSALAAAGELPVYCADQQFTPQAQAFVAALENLGIRAVMVSEPPTSEPSIGYWPSRQLVPESYQIIVKNNHVQIKSTDTAGAAYATSDLLRRVEIQNGKPNWENSSWQETPDFSYRSLMVDMGRNPHSLKTLKHVVDTMWFYRGNYLHLHLTDDQLVSWPSEIYPELKNARAGWTLDQFRELETYSQARGVTIVPELEVPGHSGQLRRLLPKVFGKTPRDLASHPNARKAIQALIAEMLGVFQSTPYMHIGGDEVHGVSAKAQRDLINQLNEFIKTKNRKTIVWEGARIGNGENKVATDVIHMAWAGRYVPMPKLIKAGYTVINASWDPFYIVDHYPRNIFTAIALDQIYHSDLTRLKHVAPGLASFRNPQRVKNTDNIIGFCMPWWEGREENILSLTAKRFGAAATRAWDFDSKVSFEQYYQREETLFERLETISGFELPKTPMASPEEAKRKGNLAFGAKVTPSKGAKQPHFSPQRLTNGITDQFDLFLGYPTKPQPLLIDIELNGPAAIGRIRIHETAVGAGWEKYRLYISTDGLKFTQVSKTRQGDRGKERFLDHQFEKQTIKIIRIETEGFEGFTFPSFSRLTEVEAFAR